jgi:hypothetical protein
VLTASGFLPIKVSLWPDNPVDAVSFGGLGYATVGAKQQLGLVRRGRICLPGSDGRRIRPTQRRPYSGAPISGLYSSAAWRNSLVGAEFQRAESNADWGEVSVSVD